MHDYSLICVKCICMLYWNTLLFKQQFICVQLERMYGSNTLRFFSIIFVYNARFVGSKLIQYITNGIVIILIM